MKFYRLASATTYTIAGKVFHKERAYPESELGELAQRKDSFGSRLCVEVTPDEYEQYGITGAEATAPVAAPAAPAAPEKPKGGVTVKQPQKTAEPAETAEEQPLKL